VANASGVGSYIPRLGNVVTVHGVISRLVVIGIDKARETAVVATTTIPTISYSVPWVHLSRLDEDLNSVAK
jgi:hypothetical protein